MRIGDFSLLNAPRSFLLSCEFM